jgi:hypothetical protein
MGWGTYVFAVVFLAESKLLQRIGCVIEKRFNNSFRLVVHVRYHISARGICELGQVLDAPEHRCQSVHIHLALLKEQLGNVREAAGT